MSNAPSHESDLSKDSFGKQLASFDRVYWICNWIELVERYAYVGVRVVCPLFIVGAFAEGGLELTHEHRGDIFAVWAFVQTFIPVLSGGLADRFGYKLCIALSIVINIVAYLVMGYTVFLAESLCGMPLAEARAKGVDHAYAIFFAGVLLLAFGTGIFKPGLQGTIAVKMPRGAASLGWGIFYQIVNVGGFLGPLVAGVLRVQAFRYVFLASAAVLCLNFIPLLVFREPSHNTTTKRPGIIAVLYRTMKGLLEPRLFFFTISFAGFWLMFMQLFDSLPVYITDWVDSRGLATTLRYVFGFFGEAAKAKVPVVDAGNLAQEWMVNVNALQICLLMFFVGYLTGKLRSLTAIILGVGVATLAILLLGVSASGWMVLAAIVTFSLGEMMSSPTTNRYLASIAPAGKEGQYMGYVNFTVGIGWSIGNIVGGRFYEGHCAKASLAGRYMVDHLHMAQDKIDAIPKDQVMGTFEKAVHMDTWGAHQLLWETYQPYWLWFMFAMIGAAAMLAVLLYTLVVNAANKNPRHTLNTQGRMWVLTFLIPICLGLALATWNAPDSIALWLNLVFFSMLLVVGLLAGEEKPEGIGN